MPASLTVKELWYGNEDGRFVGVGARVDGWDGAGWRKPKVLLLLLKSKVLI